MEDLNPIVHQPTRLRIMASLSALGGESKIEFTALRDLLDLTDGNLGTHLRTLEEAGYVRITKTFVGRRPCTFVAMTDEGRIAFQTHVRALEELIQHATGGES